jgi:cobalamin biosynthesis Mg chelatase CobN
MTDQQPDPAASKHPNRPFAIAMVVLVLLFLAGLAGMAVWMAREMGEFNPQGILSRITGKEVAIQLTDVPKAEDEQVVSQATTQVVQTSQVEETVVSGITDDKPIAKPTPGVIQATRTPIPTPMPTTEVAVVTTVAVATPEVPLATDTGSGGATTNETSEATTEASTETTTGQSTGSSSDPTSETVSGTPTGSISAPATSELPDTGFMDELGLPMLAMLGVILFLTILLVKYLRTSL